MKVSEILQKILGENLDKEIEISKDENVSRETLEVEQEIETSEQVQEQSNELLKALAEIKQLKESNYNLLNRIEKKPEKTVDELIYDVYIQSKGGSAEYAE